MTKRARAWWKDLDSAYKAASFVVALVLTGVTMGGWVGLPDRMEEMEGRVHLVEDCCEEETRERQELRRLMNMILCNQDPENTFATCQLQHGGT